MQSLKRNAKALKINLIAFFWQSTIFGVLKTQWYSLAKTAFPIRIPFFYSFKYKPSSIDRFLCKILINFSFSDFKISIIKGVIISFIITHANVDDVAPLKKESFLKNVFGILFGQKEYISKELNKILFIDRIHLITSIRKNMKNSLISISDNINFRKRSVIETVNDELKKTCVK